MTLFDLFRCVLVVLILSYCTVRLSMFVWAWQAGKTRACRHERVIRRYLEASMIGLRLRRFWFDLMQIAVLALILWWVVSLHA
jgi:hypothetical protein